MSWIKTVWEVIRNRPFYIFKYAKEAFLFSWNYVFWKAMDSERVKIGKNLRTLTTFCFQAEKPNGRIEVGDDFTAYYNCKISSWGEGKIKIGAHCSFGSGTRMDCRESISIGEYVLISWDVLIADFDPHPIDPEERADEMQHSQNLIWPNFSRGAGKKIDYKTNFITRPILIEDKVWIGERALILKGVKIGYGSLVAAGAVVTHDVPAYSVVAGNPARVVKKIENSHAKRP
jgi:acetyltransferase-like isoleucine patch superfamily enzyme